MLPSSTRAHDITTIPILAGTCYPTANSLLAAPLQHLARDIFSKFGCDKDISDFDNLKDMTHDKTTKDMKKVFVGQAYDKQMTKIGDL